MKNKSEINGSINSAGNVIMLDLTVEYVNDLEKNC